MNRFVMTAIAVALLAVRGPAFAQRLPGAAPSPGPGWFSRVSHLDHTDGLNATAAEYSTIVTRLAAVEALLRRADALARPNRFEGEVHFAMAIGSLPDVDPRTQMLAYRLSIAFWAPTFKINSEGVSPIDITVNPSARTMTGEDDRPLAQDDDGDIWLELPVGDPMPGATSVYGKLSQTEGSTILVLLTAGREPPLLPVSQERYLKAMILQLEGKNQEEWKRVKEALAHTPYETWMAGAAQRKRERDEAAAMIADKAQAAKMREALEKTEREVTEQLKASDASDREQSRRMAANPLGDKYRAQIAAMTPGERAAPAWMVGGVLASPGTPFARRLVTLNPALYRVRRSRLEVRAIMVLMRTGGYVNTDGGNCACWPNVDRAVYAAYRQLDWAALTRMLDPVR